MDDKPTGGEPPEETLPEDRQPREGEPDVGGPRFDLPLDLNQEGGVPPDEEPAERSGTLTVIVIAGLILIGAAVVLWWWYTSRGPGPAGDGAAEAPTAVVDEAAPEPEAESEAAEAAAPASEPEPDLAGSDSLVRELVAGLSRHAEWLAWLAPEELTIGFVRSVGAVAYDEPPQNGLEPLQPEDGFSVVRRGQRFYPAETSYRRYDLAVDVFDSVDVAGAAGAYEQLEPLFERAHDELGYPGEFGDTLELAVTKLLSTPMPESPPELRLRVISFEYVDPALESLSPAQKLLLRLGPENGDRVRSKLRELYGALE
ncbi:MAG: DUF3014 domain-containing protein [Holophagales bacterium]|nr:DUF3014 domain-containing protein [Holophagales bacterium]MYF94879.1 DUF3014 domain-containing protein [Holophagales bacterium]